MEDHRVTVRGDERSGAHWQAHFTRHPVRVNLRQSGGVLNLKTKHATIGAFPVIGYVPGGKRIEAVLIAERTGRRLTRLGRVEFRRRGVLNQDAREALAFLTRSRDRRACWIEPRLIATVRHFGRTAEGYLRAPVLEGLSICTSKYPAV